MDALDRLCLRIARRRRLERCLARLLPAIAAAGLAGATAIAVVRLALPDGGWLVPALAAAAAVAPLLALPAALRRRDPPWLIAGCADRLAGCDGLAMALAAVPHRDSGWMERIAGRIAAARLPPPDLRRVPAALLAAGLCAAAWFIPQASSPPLAPPAAMASVSGATAALAALAEERLAPPETIADLAERLSAVRESLAERGLDQQTWAALDALERDLAATRAQAADALADALAKADALAGLAADGDAAARAAADLAAALAELEARAPGLAAKLPPGAEGEALLRLAEQAMQGGELTEAQRQALQRWGLDPARAGQGQGQGQGGDAEAARRLADRLANELAGRAGMGGPEPGREDGQPGGGPGRGGGHSELTWGDIQRVEGGFRDRLDAGTPNNPQAGAAVGTQARAVREDELAGGPGERGATAGFAATDADARTVIVAPRHKPAVGAYMSAAATPGAAP
jgi:hypothetical protein